jgi:two-component system, OmpR family, response regulator VicR
MPIDSKPRKIPAKRILVVDDEPQVAETIRMVLTYGGHSVEIAEDGNLALSKFEAGKYDLIITDFALGKMNGLELARTIKSRSATQPIMLITAYAESVAMGEDRLANIDFLLGKPFSLEQLQEGLKKIFPVT